MPGCDVSNTLGITKWEEPEVTTMQDDQAPAPKLNVPVYDVESWRKYGPFEGDPIVEVTEKLHGTNSRTVWCDGQLHVGSHRTWKKESETNLWWKMVVKYGLKEKLALPRWEKLVFYYETYGEVQDLHYGVKGAKIAVFDIYNGHTGQWLSTSRVHDICQELDLPQVPPLFYGKQSEVLDQLEGMSKGKSTLADNIREGVVIKTVDPGYDMRYGRTILKLVGEDYLLRRGGTERH
jgi:RNA ligase (TIGR02306 family)